MTALTHYYTKWLVYYQTNMIKPKIVPFKLSVEVSWSKSSQAPGQRKQIVDPQALHNYADLVAVKLAMLQIWLPWLLITDNG